MPIVGGLDIHRKQITFDYLDTVTGEVKRAEEYPEGDFRRGDPRYQGENFDANMRAAQTVREVARSLGVKPGQVAIAWLLQRGDDEVTRDPVDIVAQFLRPRDLREARSIRPR